MILLDEENTFFFVLTSNGKLWNDKLFERNDNREVYRNFQTQKQ